jgi:hypothetical protein
MSGKLAPGADRLLASYLYDHLAGATWRYGAGATAGR